MFWKILFASLVIIISVCLQLVTEKPCVLSQEEVAISGPKTDVFEFLSKIESYPKWHPGLGHIEAVDPSRQLHVGKMYTERGHYPVFGDVTYSLVMTGYSPSTFLGFSSDSILLPVYELTLTSDNSNVTRVVYHIVSRRNSYLFKYAFSPFLQFAYKQQTLQALFNLRMLYQKS